MWRNFNLLNIFAKKNSIFLRLKVTKVQDHLSEHLRESSVPQSKAKLNKFYKFLVHRYSKQNYPTVNDVPDIIPSSQLYYAKDKARATATLFLIGMTVVGSLAAIYIGKRDRKLGYRHADDIIKRHAEYSKSHQDMIKNMKK